MFDTQIIRIRHTLL